MRSGRLLTEAFWPDYGEWLAGFRERGLLSSAPDGAPRIGAAGLQELEGFKVRLKNAAVEDPAVVALEALSAWTEMTGGNSAATEVFLARVRLLEKSLRRAGENFCLWKRPFGIPPLDLQEGWAGSAAQGLGLAVLVRAYEHTGDLVHLQGARCAFAAFLHEIRPGGLTHSDEEGKLWFEEYPLDPPRHFLRGLLIATAGIQDFLLVSGDVDAQRLFAGGTMTLLTSLEKFDTGRGLRRALVGRELLDSRSLQEIETLLNYLFQTTGEELFQVYARKAEEYRSVSATKKGILRKLGLKRGS